MSVNNENERRAGPYLGDGVQTTFPFNFKVFASNQVKVITSADGLVESTISPSQYSVTLEADQDSAEGGSVNLHSPLPNGQLLTILSDVPYTQPLNLTSRGGFYPDVINSGFDRCVILAQQLREQLNRTLIVPATSSQTPEQLLNTILETATTANEYAAEAKASLDKTVLLDANVTANANSVALMKSSVDESEQNVSALASQVNEYSDELILVADNLDTIKAIETHKDAIEAIATDFQGFPFYGFDGGNVGDPNESMIGIGGVLRICADNIDVIREVAESLKDTAMLTNLAEAVDEIGSTDYVEIDNTGNTGA